MLARTAWASEVWLRKAGAALLTGSCAAAMCAGCAWAAQRRAGASAGQGSLQAEEAVSSEPQSLEKSADLYMARKYFREAADAYQKALLAEPKNAQLHNKLGIAYHQLLDYNAARKSYQKAIQLNPKYAQAINNLAAVEYAQKRYRASVLDYLKALKLTPGDAVIYSNLGTAYFAMNRFDYATSAYKFALQLDPKIFERQGRTGNIVQQRDEKNAAQFHFYLAKTYAEMQDKENTLLYLQKAWEDGFKDWLKAVKDKAFDFLAEEQRFKDLVSKIELSEAQKSQQEAGR